VVLAFKIAANSDSEWSKLIARESNSPYSHVEGWLSGAQNKAFCFSSREIYGAGFKFLDLTDSSLWEIVPIDLTFDQISRTQAFCQGSDGKGYDGVGLIGYALKDPAIHDYSKVFCSEVWAEIAAKCWGKILPRDPWLISPGDLYTLVKENWKV
jgi:hypothetical protein